MLNINKIAFKGYVRYGLNPDEGYMQSKEKCAKAISRCPSSIQKEIADTLNNVIKSLKKIPTNDEFMVNAEYNNSSLTLTAVEYNENVSPYNSNGCEVQLKNMIGWPFDKVKNTELLKQFEESVKEKFTEEGKEFVPKDVDSIMDYLV